MSAHHRVKSPLTITEMRIGAKEAKPPEPGRHRIMAQEDQRLRHVDSPSRQAIPIFPSCFL